MSYRRVTVTVPADVLDAADALARRLDRSRSWVVADALRRYGAAPAEERTAQAARTVREPAPAPYAVASRLGEQRLAQLDADLRLTPEQRVREAQRTVELALRLHRPPRAHQVIAFDTYEEYLNWKEKDTLW